MDKFLKDIIRQAGSLAKDYYLRGVKSQAKSDPTDVVTEADLAVEDFLVEKIKARYPDHGIMAEERDEVVNPQAEYTWVIDAIDGTRNFAKHIAVWCVMIGVAKAGKPYLGAIYDAINDELFFAQTGQGAYLNDQKIKVGNHGHTEHCMIVYSGGVINENSPYNSDKFKEYKSFYTNLTKEKGHWVHNYGCSLTLAYVAAGRVDAVAMNSGLYHDYLPGYVIATEAGAKFTDSDGQDWRKGRKDILLANSQLHSHLLKLFN